MKKTLLTWLLIAVGLTVAAAHSALADTAGKRVAFAVSSTKNPFIAFVATTLEKEAGTLGAKVTVFSANYDAAIQAQQINEAVAQKFDLIAIIPLDPRAIVPALTRAKEAAVPVLIVNSPIDAAYDHLSFAFVGEDHEMLGRIAGEVLDSGGEGSNQCEDGDHLRHSRQIHAAEEDHRFQERGRKRAEDPDRGDRGRPMGHGEQ